MRPSNADIRRLLSRVENTLGEEDRLILETLLDDVTESVESRLMRFFADMSNVVARSTAASEQMTAVTERVLAILERDLEQREAQTQAIKEANNTAKLQMKHQHELRMTWIQRLGVPAIASLVSALISGVSTYLTFGQGP